MPFLLISFYRIYDLLVMSSTLEYADDNVAYTQCSVGFFLVCRPSALVFPFVPDFLHQSLICKLFLHSTQTICVFTVAMPGCFSPFWVLPDKLCHIKSNMESTPKPRVDILRAMKRKCGCGNKRGVMCMS